jgi:hypothetical protein
LKSTWGRRRLKSRTRIWPLLSRARTLSTPVFVDPVVTVVTSRVPTFLVATPRGSVIAVAGGPAGGTKHVGGSATVPLAAARRPSDLAARRPRNSSVPPDGQSKRWAGPGRMGQRRGVGGPRFSQLGNSSAGGPPAASLRAHSSASAMPRTPCRRPIKSNKVGNKDTRERRGLVVPVFSSLSQLPWSCSSLAGLS